MPTTYMLSTGGTEKARLPRKHDLSNIWLQTHSHLMVKKKICLLSLILIVFAGVWLRGKCKPLYQQNIKAIAASVINSSDTGSSSLSFCHITGDSSKIQSAQSSVSECPEQGTKALLLLLLYFLFINEHVCMTERKKTPQKYGLIMKEESTALRTNALGGSIHHVLLSSAMRTKGCQTLIFRSQECQLKLSQFVFLDGEAVLPAYLAPLVWLHHCQTVSAAFSRFGHLTAFMMLSCSVNSLKGKHSIQIVICSQNVNKKEKTWSFGWFYHRLLALIWGHLYWAQ